MAIIKNIDLQMELQKYPKHMAVLISGDDDKYGLNDMNVEKIVRKSHGFEGDNKSYLVLCGQPARSGCFKCEEG